MVKNSVQHRIERAKRVRMKISGTKIRPRLVLRRSGYTLYAQAVDDDTGQVIMGLTGKGKNTEAAKELGARSAKALAGRKFKSVVFDRGSNKYHGVVKAFADALREGGIKV